MHGVIRCGSSLYSANARRWTLTAPKKNLLLYNNPIQLADVKGINLCKTWHSVHRLGSSGRQYSPDVCRRQETRQEDSDARRVSSAATRPRLLMRDSMGILAGTVGPMQSKLNSFGDVSPLCCGWFGEVNSIQIQPSTICYLRRPNWGRIVTAPL